jgi:predicted ribosome quality control (RQC) complex YloA/Tae2 family protein
MSTIDDLRSKVQRLTDQLKEATKSLREAEAAAAPFKPGDIIQRKGWRGETKDYRVSRLSHRYGTLSLVVNERRKNGGWMDREKDFSLQLYADDFKLIGHEEPKA